MIAFLKKEDASKDGELSSLRATVRDLKQHAERQWTDKEYKLSTNILTLEGEVKRKDDEVQ